MTRKLKILLVEKAASGSSVVPVPDLSGDGDGDPGVRALGGPGVAGPAR